ncbi:MAG: hypothetical protein SF051_02640 [Elusimicrobiota bacterium]|nr:hypothetical protein [Elusimicrobiota bacterium]
MTDAQLLAHAERLASEERAATCDLLEVLATIDQRRAYRELGCGSLYEYLVCTLRYSEAAAFRRIRAIRAIRSFPPIAVLLRDGRLTIETVTLLHPHLEDADAAKLVQQSAGLRTWQVARLLATRQAPGPERDVLRFINPPARASTSVGDTAPLLPVGSPPDTQHAKAIAADDIPPPPTTPSPAAPSRAVRVAFTADEAFLRLLQRARAVMRHKYPDGRLEGVLRDALDALLDKKDWGRRVSRR